MIICPALVSSQDGAPQPVGTSCEAVLGSWAIRSTARDMAAFLGAHLAASNPNKGGADTNADANHSANNNVDANAYANVESGAHAANMGSRGQRGTSRQTPSRRSNVDSTLAEAIRLAQQPRRPTDLPEYAIGLGWRVQLATGTRVKTGSGDGFESVRSTDDR